MDWKTVFTIEALKSYALSAVTGLVGWRAWLAKLAINLVFKLVKFLANYVEVKHEVKEKLEKYEEVINDPKSSADDIRNAADDFLK